MRIVIADDAVLLRAGLERLLTDAGHEVVAAVGEATPLLHAVTEHSPDLAVIDVRMPPSFTDEGVRAATLIRAQDPDVALLVLSQYVEERYASELIADSPRGLGYVLKDRVADVEDFLGVVDEVGRGGTWLDPEVVQQIFVRSRRRRVLEQLTPREREVLSLMAQGRSNQAIADALFVSAGSVEKHISSLLTKLDLPPVDGENRRVMAVLRYLESEDRS
ncbi:response regulator transcription factor [Brachybacterium sp. NBEC-018]|uniref:LuxR C-terminal-related transcriptional regulator n=2 Tax=Brachybacterium TaxID=43668 RepID=A0ABW4PRV4_9MICO|nr:MULTISPECIES: response regulator transcription factor [unclassified Brachybacterium]QCR54340.1 DNA-binding response regulator [Brachybacterium sp. SGAir0954]UVY83281.1 response regulator transcription factor [Brachybacterium sp. NBEC-018]